MKNEKPHLYQFDYEASQMLAILRNTMHLACNHMQNATPYGEAYENAYKTFVKIGKLMDKLEVEFLECAKAAASTGEGK